MKIQVLLLCLICVAVLADAHSIDDRINSIIAKHSANWKKKVIHHEASPVDKIPITGHKCIQDSFVNPMMENAKARFSSFAKAKGLDTKPKSVEKRATEYQNMQFVVDEAKIAGNSADPNRACYSTGSTVCLVSDFDNNGNVICDNYVCESVDILSNSLQTFLRESVMPTLTEIFTEVIQVPVSQGKMKLDADTYEMYNGMCYPSDVSIPASYTTTGVDGDFVAFVTARPCGDDGTVAYAASCNFEIKDYNAGLVGRPLAGIINFCPRYFQQFVSGSYSDFEYMGAVKVAVHELTHALGFSGWMYDSYLDSNGDYYDAPYREFTRSGTSAAGNSYSVDIIELKTPKLMSYARDHFGCTDLEGVELEDYGGSGTAGSHWELRVAGDEYMCGYINPSMPVSGLTLSLFEDMGWYKTNIEKAEYWGWGKDQGCGFVQDRCESSWPDADEGYWCTSDSNTLKCTPDHKAKGECHVYVYTSTLPAYYQHFSNSKVGGGNTAADVCPFTESDQSAPDYCVDTSQSGSGSVFEVYSSSSACFHLVQGSTETPVCYSYTCVNETAMTVTINGQSFDCPTAGGKVSVSSKINNAQIECPPASLLCRGVVGVDSAGSLSVSMLVVVLGVILALAL